MANRKTLAIPADITPTTRLRLDVAAAIAFPEGGVTAANLRAEARKDRLAILRIGNKDFVTLKAIDEMCECLLRRGSVFNSVQHEKGGPAPGSSAMERARKARDAALATLDAPNWHLRAAGTSAQSKDLNKQHSGANGKTRDG